MRCGRSERAGDLKASNSMGITRATPSHTIMDTDLEFACGNTPLSTSDADDEFLPKDLDAEVVQPVAGIPVAH